MIGHGRLRTCGPLKLDLNETDEASPSLFPRALRLKRFAGDGGARRTRRDAGGARRPGHAVRPVSRFPRCWPCGKRPTPNGQRDVIVSLRRFSRIIVRAEVNGIPASRRGPTRASAGVPQAHRCSNAQDSVAKCSPRAKGAVEFWPACIGRDSISIHVSSRIDDSCVAV